MTPDEAAAYAALTDAVQALTAAMGRMGTVASPLPAPPAPAKPVASPVAAKITSLLRPRGVKANNPGDIRISQDRFLGEVIPSADKAFKTFSDMQHGIRAAAIIFRNYQTTHKLLTPYDMASRYAPESENNVALYAGVLARYCGVGVHSPVNVATSPTNMRLLLQGCFHAEGTGDFVTDQDMVAGIALANL